jgi:hypothetical protein
LKDELGRPWDGGVTSPFSVCTACRVRSIGRPSYAGLNRETTTVDHIAFEIDLADYENEKGRLEQLGLAVRTTEHAWVRWRSLYVTDPEGHTVELVCYDARVQ